MIPIKTEKEIEIMKEGGKILAEIMEQLKEKVRPGITTNELNRLAESLVCCPPTFGGRSRLRSAKAEALTKEDKIKCSFKDYKGSGGEHVEPFPACLCTSINKEIVHVAPSDRKLKEGDIISLDLGLFYKGFHTDMAITIPVISSTRSGLVDNSDPKVLRLIRVTKKALKRAIKKARPGNTFGDIGNSIERYVGRQGFNVIKDLCGHGIGKDLHEDPQVLNYGKRKTGPKIKPGMTFCIEPMVSMGGSEIKKSKDGFGWETADGSISVHFEHTMVVTRNGTEILTKF